MSEKYPIEIAKEYLSLLPLPEKAQGTPAKPLAEAIKYVKRSGQRLVIVSTVCPSYSADEQGVPDYQDLENGISPNTKRHFDYLPLANRTLQRNGIDFVHIFLMADTEVDLLPFLKQLSISPVEFTKRCQDSVEDIARQTLCTYGKESYESEGILPADRFLHFFGQEAWFLKYGKYLGRLMSEYQSEPTGKVSRALKYDYEARKILISKLLGNSISKEDGLAHIARQKAQYMAFASLTREMFEKRLVVVNHRTPNFAWMNDRITREPDDPTDLANGNYHNQIPLIELDISTLPK